MMYVKELLNYLYIRRIYYDQIVSGPSCISAVINFFCFCQNMIHYPNVRCWNNLYVELTEDRVRHIKMDYSRQA